MAIDIATLDPDVLHGREWRRLRAALKQERVARYALRLQLEGWTVMSSVRAAMREFGMSRRSVLAAVKRHRPAIEASATHATFREWSLGVRRVLRD
jgi:hypothetical protein